MADGVIAVDNSDVEARASAMESSLIGFSDLELSARDEKTTLIANKNCKNAFSDMKNSLTIFEQTLQQDVENIRSMGVAFEEFDMAMGSKNANK